jgi:hypothetical protein
MSFNETLWRNHVPVQKILQPPFNLKLLATCIVLPRFCG